MRHLRGRVIPIAPLIALATLLTACGGGGKTAPPTDIDRDCAGATAAARQIVLQNPTSITDADITRITAAADQLAAAGDAATTAVADPARQLAQTAKAYADALVSKNVERATILEGQLRREAVPVAQACGLGNRPDLVLGTTSGSTGG